MKHNTLRGRSILSIVRIYLNLFFATNKDVFLQRGETKAGDSTKAALDFKLDLRIIVNLKKEDQDVGTAELAKTSSAIESKLFNNKLKLVLVTKCHINNLLDSMPYIPKAAIKEVKIPFVQIMGLTCHVEVLSLIDKGVYLLEDVCSVEYPQTYDHIEAKGLQKIIKDFSILGVRFFFKKKNKTENDMISCEESAKRLSLSIDQNQRTNL